MNRVFYGWIVVAAAFAVMFVGFGAAYSFPAFFEPLRREFDASRATVSLVFSLAAFLYFALGAISGPLADRLGPRPVIGFGLAAVAAGMIAASFADSLLTVLIAYSIGMGIGVGFSYVPAIATVQHWFVAKRGQASGLAVMGIGLGTVVMPPVAALLIDSLSWRQAYLVLGIAAALLGALAVVALRPNPASMGLRPDGAGMLPGGPVPTQSSGPPPGLTLAEALRHRRFWLLYLAFGLNCIGTFVPFVHLAAYAQDQGLSREQGVWLVGLIGAGSMLGRFLLGPVADRVGRGPAFAAAMFGSGIMLATWPLASDFIPLALFALGFGLCYGGFVALSPAVTVDLFGARAASAVIGTLYTSVAFSTLVGPTLAGAAYDRFGSYLAPILVCAATCVIGAGIVMLMPRQRLYNP
ncbi:MFS transporter [Ferrovibrio sp.]|uniref:MFS transporter n=1 Tax=Ferrovibrio sp. TaxID=1917215 RepID=UPI003D0D94DB